MVSISLQKHTIQEILDYSRAKRKELGKLDFYQFMHDENIPPMQKLSWVPCYAHLGMSFAEILKYEFKKEPATDPLQELLNRHVSEEEHHYLWYLEDIEKLGFNHKISFVNALKSIWNEDTIGTTQIVRKISQLTYQADSVKLMSIMAMVENATDVFFDTCNQVTNELRKTTGQEYNFFGECHWGSELSHNVSKDDVQDFLATYEITEEQRNQSLEAVDKTHDIIAAFLNGLLKYAHKYPVSLV